MVQEAPGMTATTVTRILQHLLALEHLKRCKLQRLLVLKCFKCCKLHHLLALECFKCCKLHHLLVLDRLKSCKLQYYSTCWSWNISNAANYSILKGPQDHRTRGPRDQGTRATPGPSHTFAKKTRTDGLAIKPHNSSYKI